MTSGISRFKLPERSTAKEDARHMHGVRVLTGVSLHVYGHRYATIHVDDFLSKSIRSIYFNLPRSAPIPVDGFLLGMINR